MFKRPLLVQCKQLWAGQISAQPPSRSLRHAPRKLKAGYSSEGNGANRNASHQQENQEVCARSYYSDYR